jgi:hypothetical protein
VWDRFKKNQPTPGASGAPAFGAAETSVRQLISNGKFKAAVEAAKEIHKARGTAASETLLVEAYAARIQSLQEQNMAAEAKALEELVRERYPSARERLSAANGPAGTAGGRIEDLVRPLNDPALDAKRRAEIEARVAREVRDLAALAECAALPAEHPLRKAAAALERALLAVTAGPVAAEAVELPEVSHRSPLAPWKMLVRAIACFYRGEDEACRRYLEAIKPESAPARLVPAMEAMLGGKQEGLTPAAAALVSSTTSDPALLRNALAALERAFDSHKNGAILKAVRETMQACRQLASDQVEKLKQYISVRAVLADMDPNKVHSAMGGAARHDASFLRLLARALEESGDPENIALACGTWDQFRQEAVREGWFKANGPEASTLYLRMADMLRKLPDEVLEELQRNARRQGKQAAEELYFLFPETLFGRACALDPSFESFSQWMDWAQRKRAGQAERVAEAWHKIRPMDIEPILLLMEEKEKRNAFKTSLDFLAKAERIDSVHPAVRRARLRLLAASVLRHLQQKKPKLAEEKLAEMAALPQAQQGDRPAYLAALRYMITAVRGAGEEAGGQRADVERLLGSKAAAALLIFGVATAAKQAGEMPLLEMLDKRERAGLPEAVIRVAELARDMQMNQAIPGGWLSETEKQFPRSSQSLAVGQLQTLAEAGLFARRFELTYAVSAAGLQRGGPTEANFLLMRAQSLPESARRAACAVAAAQLARQHRQMDVVEKAVELVAGSPFDTLTITPEQAASVLQKEKAQKAFPTANRPGPNYGDILGLTPCNCPKCRRKRGEDVNPYDDFDEDDDSDLNEIFAEMGLPPELPPEIGKMLFEETKKALDNGEPIDSMLDRIFGPEPGFRPGRGKGRRR